MYGLRIKLIGEVTFEKSTSRYAGYGYDVFFDSLNLPYLPLGNIFKANNIDVENIRLGFARHEAYPGFISTAKELMRELPGCERFIRAYFTNEYFDEKNKVINRALKKDQVFLADIAFEDGHEDEISKMLGSIHTIGHVNNDISGEVEIELVSGDFYYPHAYMASDLCNYTSLDYSMTLISPTCIDSPYAEYTKTYDYIPGEIIRDNLIKLTKHDMSIDWDNIRCSNAYISHKDSRLLPTPISVATIKQDKNQLRYRLSSGKDPKIAEQDVGLGGTYIDSVLHDFSLYTSPQTEKIWSNDGKMYDALSPGQKFSGTIYAGDKEIRCLTKYITNNPISYIGNLTNEGYGSVLNIVTALNEDDIRSEYLVREFDLCLIAPAIIINDKGMSTVTPHKLLEEIEYKLGISGQLTIKSRYIDEYVDNSMNIKAGKRRSATKCFAKGSVIRFQCKDIIDISPIRHTFIGEKTMDGYGEVVAYPAKEKYYRLCKQVAPEMYEMPYFERGINLKAGADLINSVIRDMLRSRIEGIAHIDRINYLNDHHAHEDVPLEIFEYLKLQYDPSIDNETMIKWYEDVLTGTKENY